VARLREFLRNPFSFLTARSGQDDRLAQYVIREHQRGRSLDDILEDRYLVNRATPQQRARLLDQPEVVRALGEDAIRDARTSLSES
jgi:hypothetical protein